MPDAAAPTIRRASAADADELARMRWDFSIELDHADEDREAFVLELNADGADT